MCQPKERLSVILTSLSPGVKTNDTDCLRYSDHLPDAVPSALRCTKNNHKLVCYFEYSFYLCSALVCILRVPGMQLKGNQVQILNSPAAVSFTSDCCKQPPLATGKRFLGRRLSTETSQKTCLCIFFIAFEEKALSLMSRNYSIRHFIHHSDSEKVSYDNKLCQVYLVCPAEVSSSGHFNNKKQR